MPSALTKPPYELDAVRREFPVVDEVVYLNTGTAGVCPLSVSERLWESMRAFELGGESPSGWGAACQRMEEARARLAAYLGATTEEIAFTRNATDGVNLVVEGVQWRDGDEVLLSDQEHPSMLFPWTFLTQRRDVKLRRFTVGRTDEETLKSVADAWAPRIRLLATSHVTSQTGIRVPTERIVAFCRERGARVLFDGAQAVGQFPIDLNRLGVDFYTGNVHKWMHGPKGTGFFYVRRDRVEELTPTWTGAGTGGFTDDDGLMPSPNAQRFEYGTRDFGRYGGIAALIDWHEALGIEAAQSWSRQLAEYLRSRLGECQGITLHTPLDWSDASALTTFSVDGVPAHEYIGGVWQSHKMRLRGVHEVNGARVSTTLFNTVAEIDLLIELLQSYIR